MAFFPCSAESYLILFRRVMPVSYAGPLESENDGAGWDVPSLMAAIFARFDEAANTSQQAYFLKPHSEQTGPQASGPVKAFGAVEITRLAGADWELRLPAGTLVEAVVTDSYGDPLLVQQYATTAEAVLAVGSLGPISAPVEALFEGYEGNIPAGLITRYASQGRATALAQITAAGRVDIVPSAQFTSDRFSQAIVGRYARASSPSPLPVLVGPTGYQPRRVSAVLGSSTAFVSPPFDAADIGKQIQFEIEELEDLSVLVSQPDPIAGGVPGTLDAIAVDRGTGRLPGETDPQLADRLQLLADVVSPGAVLRTLRRVLAGTGIRYALHETRDVQGLCGLIYDVHPWDLTGGFTIPKVPGSALVGQGVFYLSESSLRRYFVVAVSPAAGVDPGFPYDATTGPVNAYDQQSGQGFYDGGPYGYEQTIARLWASLNAVRAAGVGFDIVQDPTL